MALGWSEGEVWSCRQFLWDVGRVHAEYHSQSHPCPIPRDRAFAAVRDRVLYGILHTTVWAGACGCQMDGLEASIYGNNVVDRYVPLGVCWRAVLWNVDFSTLFPMLRYGIS
jgi:hypothetical protein